MVVSQVNLNSATHPFKPSNDSDSVSGCCLRFTPTPSPVTPNYSWTAIHLFAFIVIRFYAVVFLLVAGHKIIPEWITLPPTFKGNNGNNACLQSRITTMVCILFVFTGVSLSVCYSLLYNGIRAVSSSRSVHVLFLLLLYNKSWQNMDHFYFEGVTGTEADLLFPRNKSN